MPWWPRSNAVDMPTRLPPTIKTGVSMSGIAEYRFEGEVSKSFLTPIAKLAIAWRDFRNGRIMRQKLKCFLGNEKLPWWSSAAKVEVRIYV